MKKQLDFILKAIGVLTLLFIALVLFNQAMGQVRKDSLMPVNLNLPNIEQPERWQFNAAKITGYGCFAVAGWAHGWEDAYYADPYVFEKKGWNRKFWRHNAWENNYFGDQYRNEDGSINKHKPQIFNTFRDVKHALSFIQSRTLMVGGVIVFSQKNQNWKHRAIDFVIGSAVYSFTAQQAYNIRYRN